MALIPGGMRPRIGGGTVLPRPAGAGSVGGSVGDGGVATAPPPVGAPAPVEAPRPEIPSSNGAANGAGSADAVSFQAEEADMPWDEDDVDFDDELLRLSQKVHSVLV